MQDYPRDLLELERRFSTEAACREYLFQLRWPEGFCCPRCGGRKAWPASDLLCECAACHRQVSAVTSGTIFQDSRLPLTLWFRAVWWVTSQKNGVSAMGLQRVLGLKSYKTAWTLLHRLRRAMPRVGPRSLCRPLLKVCAGNQKSTSTGSWIVRRHFMFFSAPSAPVSRIGLMAGSSGLNDFAWAANGSSASDCREWPARSSR